MGNPPANMAAIAPVDGMIMGISHPVLSCGMMWIGMGVAGGGGRRRAAGGGGRSSPFSRSPPLGGAWLP